MAQGRRKADTVITHVSLVNVYSGEILPEYSAALSGERIVYVGPERPELAGPKTEVIDGQGGALLPGFIDAHTHLDNIFTCAAYAPFALATGNTTAVTEMAMIGNALGRPGIDWFMAEAGAAPLRIRFLAPALTPPFPGTGNQSRPPSARVRPSLKKQARPGRRRSLLAPGGRNGSEGHGGLCSGPTPE